jgi:hypothetical protein
MIFSFFNLPSAAAVFASSSEWASALFDQLWFVIPVGIGFTFAAGVIIFVLTQFKSVANWLLRRDKD